LYYSTHPESIVPNAGGCAITTRPDEEVSTTIDISNYLQLKIQALAAHQTQEDSRHCVETLEQDKESLFANNEFFYLVNSKERVKETDLFQ
jgi:LmbE family N-acetylglucosaminyl deacetylase